MDKGVEHSLAFEVMRAVYMGHGLSDAHWEIMEQGGVPEWYRESCCKVRYLFPKAHVVQYIMLAFRLAWFKAHHTAAFYEVYFSQYADSDMDISVMDTTEVCRQIEALKAKLGELDDDEEHEIKNTLRLLRICLEVISLGEK